MLNLRRNTHCQQNAIDEKQFYYYQRRIRAIIAEQSEQPALPEGRFSVAASSVRQQTNRPQIVKLRFPGMALANAPMISFSVNGMSFFVPENIPASFLAKLPEAASHGSR